jgi:hypothetical protein
MGALLQDGHRRRGSGISTDQLGEIELAIALHRLRGKAWFVNSAAASGGNGSAWDSAYTSIVTAIASASANDRIYLAPGHTETVIAANGVDITKAGLQIIGIGSGEQRPTFNFTTATGASVRINANSVLLSNLRFTGGLDALTGVLTINGKTDVILRDLEYLDVTGQANRFLLASNDSDRLLIEGYRGIHAAAAGPVSSLVLDGCDDLTIRDFDIRGNFSGAAIDFVTTLSARVRVYSGYIWTQNAADLCIKDTITASTGAIGPDLYFMLTDNSNNITEAITGATFHVFDNVYVCNLVNEKALLINWTASADL